jgi:serine/threonine protein kinase
VADTYGRWQVEESLGEGGQAVTYLVRAVDSEDTDVHVLKRLKNLSRIDRFRREMETGLQLEHKNIVEVVDADIDGEKPFIVTRYYRGGTMAQARPFEFSNMGRLFDLFGQICDGILEAHAHGVIHRDLKPDNIFLSGDKSGDAVIGDFGLCFVDEEPRITGSSEAVGPRLYMAPELEDGRLEHATPASDVYSLGKVLYWLMSSGRMFSREKHRQQEHNLVEITGNRYQEHVNRLLDHAILVERDARWSLASIREELPRTKRLVLGEYNPVGPDEWARCYYCGIGNYIFVGRDRETLERANFIAAGQPAEARILVCNHCGHVQTFRPDIGRQISLSHASPWDPQKGVA